MQLSGENIRNCLLNYRLQLVVQLGMYVYGQSNLNRSFATLLLKFQNLFLRVDQSLVFRHSLWSTIFCQCITLIAFKFSSTSSCHLYFSLTRFLFPLSCSYCTVSCYPSHMSQPFQPCRFTQFDYAFCIKFIFSLRICSSSYFLFSFWGSQYVSRFFLSKMLSFCSVIPSALTTLLPLHKLV